MKLKTYRTSYIMTLNIFKFIEKNKLYWLGVFALILIISGCSNVKPIERYKDAVNDKDIRSEISGIEELKDNMLSGMEEELFLDSEQQILDDMSYRNKELKEKLDEIKIKDSSIKILHNNIVIYVNNNDAIIMKSYELLSLYQSLLDEQDKDKIQEIYSRIVQTARSIDTLSGQSNSYKNAWEEGLVTMDIKN